jgi:hypothetical protein
MTMYAVRIGLEAVSLAPCPWHGQDVYSLLVNSVDLNAVCSKCGRTGIVDRVITDGEHWALIRPTPQQWATKGK